MEIPIACCASLRDEDLIILALLRDSADMLTVSELVSLTGFSDARVKRSLRVIARQAAMARGRRRLNDYYENT